MEIRPIDGIAHFGWLLNSPFEAFSWRGFRGHGP